MQKTIRTTHNVRARKRNPPTDRVLEMMIDDAEMAKLQIEIETERETEVGTRLETEAEKDAEIEIEIEIEAVTASETERIEDDTVRETDQAQEKTDTDQQVLQKVREEMMRGQVDVDPEVQQLTSAEEMTPVIVMAGVEKILSVMRKTELKKGQATDAIAITVQTLLAVVNTVAIKKKKTNSKQILLMLGKRTTKLLE